MLAGFLDLVVLQAFTGASVGKHCLGLRVVDENGEGPSFLRTLARWLLLIVDSGCFLVGLIAVNTTRLHRRVGDLVCRTRTWSDRADAGRPIDVTLYRVPRSGAATAVATADRPTAPRDVRPGFRRATPRPSRGSDHCAEPDEWPATATVDARPATPPSSGRSRRPSRELAVTEAGAGRSPRRARPRPAPSAAGQGGEGATAEMERGGRDCRRYADEVEYLEPDPRDRPNGS